MTALLGVRLCCKQSGPALMHQPCGVFYLFDHPTANNVAGLKRQRSEYSLTSATPG